jgi:tetratricopeptide (TPR) repeat protein
MVLAFSVLAVLLLASPAAPSVPQKSFEEIAKQAEAARTADRVDDAILLYSLGVRLHPFWSDGWWSLGSLLYDQDRFLEATAAFDHFVALTAKPGPAYAFLGLCEYETRDYGLALKHFREWATHGWSGTPDLIDVAVFHFALLLTREGRFLEALFLLATEEGKTRSSPALIEAMGLASLRMTSLPEDYPQSRREMVWLAGQAAFYASSDPHDFSRADSYSQRLLIHYEREPGVHFFRGTLFGFERKNVEAAREFQRELQISPQHVAAMVELASIDITDDQAADALALAKTASELEPKNPEAHHIFGQALFATGQFQESSQELEIAKHLAPDSSMIRLHLARAYSALGRKREADQEVAAVKVLKGKEQILAPPGEKATGRKQAGPPEP